MLQKIKKGTKTRTKTIKKGGGIFKESLSSHLAQNILKNMRLSKTAKKTYLKFIREKLDTILKYKIDLENCIVEYSDLIARSVPRVQEIPDDAGKQSRYDDIYRKYIEANFSHNIMNKDEFINCIKELIKNTLVNRDTSCRQTTPNSSQYYNHKRSFY